MNYFLDLNAYQVTTTSPLRNNWFEVFMKLKYRVQDSDGKKIGMSDASISRSHDLSKIYQILEDKVELDEISRLIYEDGWGAPVFENELQDRVKTRGGNLLSNRPNTDAILISNPPIKISHPHSSLCEEEILEFKEIVERKNITGLAQALDYYESELYLNSGDFSLFLALRNEPWITDSIKDTIDSFLKTSQKWLDSDVIFHQNHNELFILKTEWILSGAVIPNNYGERTIFKYIRNDIGINIEKYLDKILVNELSSFEYRLLLLVSIVRNFGVKYPRWSGSKFISPISQNNLEEMHKIISIYHKINPEVIKMLNTWEKIHLDEVYNIFI